jgi:triphosphoribosyl-dephospho-CoA synthase
MTSQATSPLSLRELVTIACLAEITAPKPGNVHRGADFEDTTFGDFAISAVVIGDVIASSSAGIGEAVYRAVARTQHYVGQNTNLGIALLLAPLAAVSNPDDLRNGLSNVLKELTAHDANRVYEAIRIAAPGGLGNASRWDVNQEEMPSCLLSAMREAADRDAIARQFTTGFQDVFTIADWLAEMEDAEASSRIVRAHVRSMATWVDTLILRKCGQTVADQAKQRAQKAHEARKLGDEAYWNAVGDLDFWLRGDGNRRNPGSTADLICAAVFVLLRDGRLQPPIL